MALHSFLQQLKLQKFKCMIITYEYFNIWSRDKDHSTQRETVILIFNNIKSYLQKLPESGLKCFHFDHLQTNAHSEYENRLKDFCILGKRLYVAITSRYQSAWGNGVLE